MIRECAVKQQKAGQKERIWTSIRESQKCAVRAGQISPRIRICRLSFLCVVLSHVGGLYMYKSVWHTCTNPCVTLDLCVTQTVFKKLSNLGCVGLCCCARVLSICGEQRLLWLRCADFSLKWLLSL